MGALHTSTGRDAERTREGLRLCASPDRSITTPPDLTADSKIFSAYRGHSSRGTRMRRRVLVAGISVVVAAAGSTPIAHGVPPRDALQKAVPLSVVAKKKANKKTKGTLRVKVIGSGSYTVTGRGLRRSATTSKAFRVRVGRYTVTAPKGSVSPAMVRVKKGKTARVAVRFHNGTQTPPKGEAGPVNPPPTPLPHPPPSSTPPPSGPIQVWVDAGSQATVSTRDGYAITIPAGALQERSLVTVTPLAPQAGVIPRADFHIDGAWSGQVTVSLPWQPADADLRPVALHEAEDGLRISAGDAVNTGEVVNGVPTASTRLSSLSPVSMAGWSCEGMSAQAKAAVPMCADVTDVNVAHWFNVDRARSAGWRIPSDPVTLCGADEDPAARAVGSKPKHIGCTTGPDSGQAGFQFRNMSKDDLLLWRVGAVYKYQVGANAVASSVQVPEDPHWLIQSISNATKGSYLVPGASLTVRKNRQSPTTRLHLEGDLQATAVWYQLPDMASVLDDQLAAWLPGHSVVLQALQENCSGNQQTLKTVVANCIRDNLRSALDAVIDGIGTEPPTGKIARFKNAASIGSALLRTMDAATYAASLEAAAAPNWPGPNSAIDLRAYIPVDPPTARGGSDFIARDPATQRSVRVLNGQPYTIPDADTFNCLALTRVVWDLPALASLDISPSQETACDNAARPVWTYTPTAADGNTGTNVILRNFNDNAWLISSAGEIQTIPDGGTYECLAAANPVIWNVPQSRITAWSPVSAGPAICGSSPPTGVPGEVQRVSTDSFGEQGNRDSGWQVWSPDGTKIAFASYASNLAPGDTNNASDVFVKTLASGAIERISTSSSGQQGHDVSHYGSTSPTWSPDGTKIAFASYANNLVPGDTNNASDVFVKTLVTGDIQRVSTDDLSTQLYGHSYDPDWSPDGTKIAFSSDVNNGQYATQIYVKWLTTGNLNKVSCCDELGRQADLPSREGRWSPDSTKIAFVSGATNLVPEDTNSESDVFVKSLESGSIQRISEAPGIESDGYSGGPSWSPDGTQLAFSSYAHNLAPNDTNGGYDVFVKTLANGALRLVSTDVNGGQNYRCGEVGVLGGSWSPDGSRLTLWSDCDLLAGSGSGGLFGHLFVKDLATDALQLIDSTSLGALGAPGSRMSSVPPSWSPDGNRISFTSYTSDLVPGDTNGVDDVFVKTLP